MTGQKIIEFLQRKSSVLNKDVDLVIKDALKKELKEDILGSSKYEQA